MPYMFVHGLFAAIFKPLLNAKATMLISASHCAGRQHARVVGKRFFSAVAHVGRPWSGSGGLQ